MNFLRALIWAIGAVLCFLMAIGGLAAALESQASTGMLIMSGIFAVFGTIMWIKSKAARRGRATRTRATLVAIADADYSGMSAKDILKGLDRSKLGTEPWHNDAVSEKQRRVLDDYDVKYSRRKLTKGEASLIIGALFGENDGEEGTAA